MHAIQSAHAILLLDGNYVLQLRDNKPTIADPGQWSLFGGKIQKGETSLQTIRREVYEELLIEPHEYRLLWYVDHYAAFEGTEIRSWFFEADVSAVWLCHKLSEGQGVGVFTFEQIGDLDMPTEMKKTIERFHSQTQSMGHVGAENEIAQTNARHYGG